jgi:5-methylcytosine-specific restriction endonuclease McrA
MIYEQQLLDPRWLEKRQRIIDRDWGICQVCMSGKNLQVHHKRYYNDGRMAWDYPDSELITLCHACHQLHHKDRDHVVVKPDRWNILWDRVRTDLGLLRGLVRKMKKNG